MAQNWIAGALKNAKKARHATLVAALAASPSLGQAAYIANGIPVRSVMLAEVHEAERLSGGFVWIGPNQNLEGKRGPPPISMGKPTILSASSHGLYGWRILVEKASHHPFVAFMIAMGSVPVSFCLMILGSEISSLTITAAGLLVPILALGWVAISLLDFRGFF